MKYQYWSINLSSSRKTSYISLSDFHPLNSELLSAPPNNIFVNCLIWLFSCHVFHFSCVFSKLLFKKLSFLKAETESSILKINFWKSNLVRSLSYVNCCMDLLPSACTKLGRTHTDGRAWSGSSSPQLHLVRHHGICQIFSHIGLIQSLLLAILFPAPKAFIPSLFSPFCAW